MAFLRNDAINRVNLHSGIQALAQGAGYIFFLVFLLRAGVSVPAALLAQAAIVTGRFLLRPAMLPLARRWGLKPMLIVGTLGVALQYPLLAEVDGIGVTLFGLCIVASVGEVFYWLAYNAYFAAIGDAEHRGHQIGAREALVAVAGVVAPFLGAWALVTAGPRLTFAAVGLVQALAVLPLLGAPNVAVKLTAPGAFRAARPAVVLLAIDGWFDACFFFVWQIALFVSLGENIPAYGGAMALAGLAGAAAGLVIGRHVDAGHGRRAVAVAYGAAAAVVSVRAASLGHRGGGHAPAHPGTGDGHLQHGQGLTLFATLPDGDGGWLGCRLLRRLPDRRGPLGRGLVAVGCDPDRAAGASCRRAAAPPLLRAKARFAGSGLRGCLGSEVARDRAVTPRAGDPVPRRGSRGSRPPPGA